MHGYRIMHDYRLRSHAESFRRETNISARITTYTQNTLLDQVWTLQFSAFMLAFGTWPPVISCVYNTQAKSDIWIMWLSFLGAQAILSSNENLSFGFLGALSSHLVFWGLEEYFLVLIPGDWLICLDSLLFWGLKQMLLCFGYEETIFSAIVNNKWYLRDHSFVLQDRQGARIGHLVSRWFWIYNHYHRLDAKNLPGLGEGASWACRASDSALDYSIRQLGPLARWSNLARFGWRLRLGIARHQIEFWGLGGLTVRLFLDYGPSFDSSHLVSRDKNGRDDAFGMDTWTAERTIEIRMVLISSRFRLEKAAASAWDGCFR